MIYNWREKLTEVQRGRVEMLTKRAEYTNVLSPDQELLVRLIELLDDKETYTLSLTQAPDLSEFVRRLFNDKTD